MCSIGSMVERSASAERWPVHASHRSIRPRGRGQKRMREKKEVGECGVANALLSSYLCSLKYAPTLIMFATCWQLHSKTETQNLSVHQGPRRGCHRPRGGCKGAFRLQVGGREVRGRKREFAIANDYVLEYVSSMGGRPRAPRERRAYAGYMVG